MNKNISEFERFVIIVLAVITVSQFCMWGYQSFLYLLSQMFNVDTSSTLNDLFIGIIAMIGSVFIVIGISQRMMNKVGAYSSFMYGVVAFIIKNVLDLVNEIIVFINTTQVVDQWAIRTLASNMGFQLAQLMFWIFILFYYRNKFKGSSTAIPTSQPAV